MQVIPHAARECPKVIVFQRTPSSVQPRGDWPTNPNWARKLNPGWQQKRRDRMVELLGKRAGFLTLGKSERE